MMKSLKETYQILLREKPSSVRRDLLDQIDSSERMIAIKGTRGVGKTNFLLDYSREYYRHDATALYVNVNNLFISNEGLACFLERFYRQGGRTILLDQVYKYPGWDEELRSVYENCPELKFVFTTASIVRVKSNPVLKSLVKMYHLKGLSFREFLELETGMKFKKYTLPEILQNHEQIAKEIVSEINPLLYFESYLKYGYYPIYREEKSHIDYLLKNINLTLEFDIPYYHQIELTYLPKLKRLLYLIATSSSNDINISKMSKEIGLSRATVLNYLWYMKDARLLTLLYNEERDEENSKKPNKIYMHDPNLMNAICLDEVDYCRIRRTFFINQLSPNYSISSGERYDFMVDHVYPINVCRQRVRKGQKAGFCLEDNVKVGKDNLIPLWLIGFTY